MHQSSDFCCHGCETVYSLLHDSGLSRFYELKPKQILPLLGYFTRQINSDWVDEYSTITNSPSGRIKFQIEGIQCAACIWVIKELARRMGGAIIHIDTTLGEISIGSAPENFSLREFIETLQKFGYRCAPQHEKQTFNYFHHNLLVRLGACSAIAMFSMVLSLAVYLGLDSTEPELLGWIINLNAILATLSVSFGGSYFFKRVAYSIRARVMHFDIPIAIGIAATYLGSMYQYAIGNWESVYFDTLTVFISLMLAGRYVQVMVLSRNRNSILHENRLSDLMILRKTKSNDNSQTTERVTFSAIKHGDNLIIAPGGILPVNSRSNEKLTEWSLRWISGESDPAIIRESQVIPAGSQLLSPNAVEVSADSDYSESYISSLRPPEENESDNLPVIWKWVSKLYVQIVLVVAFCGGIYWAINAPHRVIPIVVAVLVITCPCSIGIAIPLARSYANKALMQRGVFARNASLLDRWQNIRQIFLDKTGTLTLSSLKVVNQDHVRELDQDSRQILFNMAARSHHPISKAIYELMSAQQPSWLSNMKVLEIPGQGLSTIWKESTYKLERMDPSNKHSVSFSKNEKIIISISTNEEILSDAAEAIHKLLKMGVSSTIISGDSKLRVAEMAIKLKIPKSNAIGECSPQDKLSIIENADQNDSLMLGDGLNDALAFEKAYLCGTPIWDRSILTSHADFYFISDNLSWLPDIFLIGNKLKATILLNLTFATIYNAAGIALALSGILSPILCAILMPLSSITVIIMSSMRMRAVLK